MILKCLAKEPPVAYATAQALADDLRGFAKAARSRPAGRACRNAHARWARKNRRSVVLVASAAVISMLLVVGGILDLFAVLPITTGVTSG